MLISVERSVHERQYNRQWTIALVTSVILITEIVFGLYRGKDSLIFAHCPTASACYGGGEFGAGRNGALYSVSAAV